MHRAKRPTDEAGGPGPPSRRGRMAVSPTGSSRMRSPSLDGEPAESVMADLDLDGTAPGLPDGHEPLSVSARARQSHDLPLSEGGVASPSLDRVEGFKALSLSSSAQPQPRVGSRAPLITGPSSAPRPPSISPPAANTETSTPSPAQPPLLRLHPDVYSQLFMFCKTRDLARLSQTSRFFRDRIAAWQGFDTVVVVTSRPRRSSSSSSDEYALGLLDSPHPRPSLAVSGSFPPVYPFRGSITLGGKVYLPLLDESPCCYVLDVATLLWSRHTLKTFGSSPFGSDTPQRPSSRASTSTATMNQHPLAPKAPTASSSSMPHLEDGGPAVGPSSATSTYSHAGPVTGMLGDLPNDTPTLYLFGGSHSPSAPASPPSSDSSASEPSSSEGSTDSGSRQSGSNLSSSFYRIDVASWELHDMRPVPQQDGDAPPTDGAGDGLARSWPLARRSHSTDIVQGKWLVVFGGIEVHDSTGENDIWVYDLDEDVWHHPDLPGWMPRPVFSHSSVDYKTDLFVFGGAQRDDPTNLVFDGLSRLSCIGPPSQWVWHNCRPSESFTYPRSNKAQPPRNPSISTAGSSSQEPASSQSESSSSGAVPAGGLSSSYASSAGGLESRDPRAGSGSSGESSSGSEGRTTTGSSPLERFAAGMLMLGADKLVIVGGSTIEDGYDRGTGVPFDDTSVFNVAAIDIFDTTRLHWSQIRPPATLLKKPIFFSEAVFAAIPPDLSAPLGGWKILASGKAIDLDNLVLSVAGPSDEEESSPAADASFESSAAASGEADPTVPVPPSVLAPRASGSPLDRGINVNDILSTSPPPPHLSLSPILGSASVRRPDSASRSPSEERVKTGGYISLYRRGDSLLTASLRARVSLSDSSSSSPDGPLALSEDSDSNGGRGLGSGSGGTALTSAMAVASKVTTCLVVFG